MEFIPGMVDLGLSLTVFFGFEFAVIIGLVKLVRHSRDG